MTPHANHGRATDARLTGGKLGLQPGAVVYEVGWDEDCDEAVREAVEAAAHTPLEGEDLLGAADAVLYWWRAGDGDLTDALLDVVGLLDEAGFVLLLTPAASQPDAVDASDIDEAAALSGLHAATLVPAGPLWRAVKLVPPKAARAGRLRH